MLKPLGKNVVIQVEAAEEKTAGGLVLPSAAKDKENYGVVLAVSKAIQEEGEVSVGDRVVFANYAGTTVKHDGLEVMVVDVEHVLAVLA